MVPVGLWDLCQCPAMKYFSVPPNPPSPSMILTQYLHKTGSASALKAVMVVSAAWDAFKTQVSLEKTLSNKYFYSKYLTRRLKTLVKRCADLVAPLCFCSLNMDTYTQQSIILWDYIGVGVGTLRVVRDWAISLLSGAWTPPDTPTLSVMIKKSSCHTMWNNSSRYTSRVGP